MQASLASLSYVLLLLCYVVVGYSPPASIDIIPGKPSTKQSFAQFTSQATLFDGPKVKPINDTTADWWYFDVVSSDLNYTLVLTFFAATRDSLWPETAELNSTIYMLFVLTLPDGTILGANTVGEDLAVVTVENGSSGVVGGTSNSWVGSPDMSEYNVFVDVPDLAVSGNISFRSVSIDLWAYNQMTNSALDISSTLPLRSCDCTTWPTSLPWTYTQSRLAQCYTRC